MQDAIYRYIFLKIQSDEWHFKERIPSERQLALKFSVTRAIIRKVLISLCSWRLLDTFSHSGYYISSSYKTGFFKKVIDFNFASFKSEALISSPFNNYDINCFKKIANNFDFYGHNFAKVMRITYYDKSQKPICVLDVMLNHDLLHVFPQEYLNFKNFRLFAANGQPVVYESQFATYANFAKVAETYKLKKNNFLVSYASYFNLEKKLLALARIIYLDENTTIEINNDFSDNRERIIYSDDSEVKKK